MRRGVVYTRGVGQTTLFPPHSHPFRMIDAILTLDRERCTIIKALCGDETLRLHPEAMGGDYPFSLLLEAMAQAAVPLAGLADEESPHGSEEPPLPKGMIVGIDGARLLHPARPGDRLLITASIVGRFGGMIRVRSTAEIAGSAPGQGLIAEGEFTIVLQEMM
jgi:3-hydroxymyristoyl/3-hydroxydecanoyl-(acyl carrier protein) dehydratase